MNNMVSLKEFIKKQISGDWGKEVAVNKDDIKVLCIRGADINDVNEGNYDNLPIRYIGAKNQKKLLGEGNIIIEVSGGSPTQSTGRACYVRSVHSKMICSNFCRAFEIKEEHSSQYFYYLLRSIYNLNIFFNFESKTTGIKNLLVDDALENIKVPRTSIQTQKSIAKVLSDFDSKIELNNKINQQLEAMAKTLYDYWFMQFDFPNGQGKPYKSSGGKMVYSEELKRDIPEGWEIGNISDLFDFNPHYSIKKGTGCSYIDMDALPEKGFMTKKTQQKIFSGGVKFQNGDVAIARITPCLENGKTGLITLLNDREIGFGSTEFIVLRGKKKQLSSFAAMISRSELFRKYAISNMTGTSGRKRVEANILKLFRLAIPPESILDKFENIVRKNFEIETINTKQNHQLTELRDWLLPMLMNGQISVGEVEEKLNIAAEPMAIYNQLRSINT